MPSTKTTISPPKAALDRVRPARRALRVLVRQWEQEEYAKAVDKVVLAGESLFDDVPVDATLDVEGTLAALEAAGTLAALVQITREELIEDLLRQGGVPDEQIARASGLSPQTIANRRTARS